MSYIGLQVLNKDFTAMYSEEHHAKSGGAVAPSEYVYWGARLFWVATGQWMIY